LRTLRTSDRPCSCRTQRHALSTSGTREGTTNTRTHSVRSGEAAGLIKPKSTTDCYCSNKVVSKFLSAIKRKLLNTIQEIEIAARYGAEQESLYLEHLKKYARWAATGILCYQESTILLPSISPKRLAPDFWSSFPSTATKRRRLSLSKARSDVNRIPGEAVQPDN
jgi:hypothetical protein